jgi:hypothetical protein
VLSGALVGLLCTAALLVGPTAVEAQSGDTTTSIDAGDGPSPAGNIVPRPNSGQAPDSPNDPGGWQQYLVFALIFAGLGVIVVLAVRESRRARGVRPRA